ncbi:MAG TPA: chromate resistance protein ChrB domain-containing protein [Candidatus Acidoferrales bacterium]|nr:chromate resistance protein ChrB domain-containing protein [Candidatus Acidoferrales bacterium]
MQQSKDRWLLLIHQLPPKPDYFRVKIWRRLQRLGAVAIKNSVYVLPKTAQSQEDFQWLLREIIQGKGEGSICEAAFVDGLSNEEVESLFQSARETEYRELAEEARRLAKISANKKQIKHVQLDAHLARLKRRLAEVVARDFFGAPGREAAEGLISGIEARVQQKSGKAAAQSSAFRRHDLQGKTWVTRRGIYVDRMASAWLIRRFIDPDARFKFVVAKGYKPLPGEVRFDMFEGEFTHEGEHCTFEVLIDCLGIDDAALTPIAEIVHDIDLKDSKFARDETVGIERLIAGIAMAHKEDETRLARSSVVFDGLYEYFKRKRG